MPCGDELFLPYGAFYWIKRLGIKRLGAQGEDGQAVGGLPTSGGDSGTGRKFRQKRPASRRGAVNRSDRRR